MSSDFFTERWVRSTRIMHRCAWCPEPILAQQRALNLVGKYEGDFFVQSLHPECNAAWLRDPCTIEGEACEYDHGRGQTCVETDEVSR